MKAVGVVGRGVPCGFRAWLVAGALGGAVPIASAQPRIVGGQTAERGQYPWIATVVDSSYSDNREALACGGVLVAESLVLTAAHCVFTVPAALLPNQVEVLVGAYQLSEPTDRFRVDAIYIHPSFDPVSLGSDLALLHLQEPALAVPLTVAAALPEPLSPVLALGWGVPSETGSVVDELRQVELELLDEWTCALALDAAGGGWVDGSMLCAGQPEGGADTCYGDSGGPLVAETSDGWGLLGITSFGVGCGRPGRPGVYAKVAEDASVLDWLARCVVAECETLERLACGESGSFALGQFCDGTDDCSDGSDEHADVCPLQCGDGRDVPASYACDYYADCSDGRDESAAVCGVWACLDGSEVSRTWLCDGTADCDNARDEDPSLCGLLAQCDAGTALRVGQLCDGRADCFDGADEQGCEQNVAISEVQGAPCPGAGSLIELGVDLNQNGALDGFEVQSQSYVCAGSAAPPPATLVRIDDLAASAECQGGLRVSQGRDLDGDGVLSAEETDESTDHCTLGADTRFETEVLAPGAECSAGGVRLTLLRGAVDGGARAEVAILCHGEAAQASVPDTGSDAGSDAGASASGVPWLVESDRFPVHESCPGAGMLVTVGQDRDQDGRLSLREVQSETPVCDGASGEEGCGCTLPPRRSPSGAVAGALALVAGLLLTRRRR